MNNFLSANSVLQPLFSGKTRPERHDSQRIGTKSRPVSENELFAERYFPIGAAAVDCGGNGIKVLIREPGGDLFVLKVPVENGRSIGEKGYIDKRAQEILRNALRMINEALKQHFVLPDHVHAVTTAGLRSAANCDDMLKMASEYGLNFEVIDGKTEAGLVYPVTLKGEGVQPDEHMIVIEIGGGSTELAYGTGPQKADDELSEMLELGSTRMGITDPWDRQQIAQARQRIRKVIAENLQSTPKTAQGRRTFIKASTLEHLKYAHKAMGHKRHIKDDRIPHSEIRFYLQEDGMAFLREAFQAANVTLSPVDEIKLVTKLIILDELMEALHIDQIELGFKGGLKYAVLEQLIPRLQLAVHRQLSTDLAWLDNHPLLASVDDKNV